MPRSPRSPTPPDAAFWSDSGVPIVVSEPGSTAGRAFMHAAERTAAQVSILAHKTAEANKGKIPLIQVR